MKKNFFLAMLLLTFSTGLLAQNADSIRIKQLDEVVVKGVTTPKNAPFAVANISKGQLQEWSRTGRELPFLFAQTPGVVAWSENGIGTGTVYMRIRGAAGSRINVTLDGVPLNSPEDQCVFWANMNGYASLLKGVQIQRGVGTSTNGDGAFGGNIALSTKTPALSPSFLFNTSYGSYGTYNIGAQLSSGLIGKHLLVDATYTLTSTDGFIHGTEGESGSYYTGVTWLDDNFQIRFKNIRNFEKTGQAWNGVDSGDLLNGNYGMQTGINGYSDMWKALIGDYNTLYERLNYAFSPEDGLALSTTRYQMRDGTPWRRATDNFWQNHSILSFATQLNESWKASASAHYTYGYGYYDEFRYNNKLSKFGLANFPLSDGSVLKKTDFVRRKGLDQNTFGTIVNANYESEMLSFVGGLSVQQFLGEHFGYLTYIANEEMDAHFLKDGKYTYYDSDASKLDGNTFAKATWHISSRWDITGDIQYRYVHYVTNGINDKFYSNPDGTYSNQRLDINKKYHFINPKAGFAYHTENQKIFGSIAISHREPERNNFTDNGSYPAPEAEQLTDFELGHTYSNDVIQTGINVYYMKYKNQFVQTGAISDIGEALTTNIKNSYRTGVELTLGWAPTRWLNIEGNAALSRNKILDFDEMVENWDDWEGNSDASGMPYDGDGFDVIHYDNSTLAFSPSAILNGFLTFHTKGFKATWHTGYVSRQYLDNTQCIQRSLPAYTHSDITASYSWLLPKQNLKEVILGINVNNVFDAHYAASGWVYSAIYPSGGHSNENRYREIGFFPMAGRTLLGTLTLRF
ncbi:MAG: TonB-dependent receptor plug domain-containing protein [Bacteroidaceae bacterium]|nr:TonB-dependent receptor plug domain-containing protein [Bacteroidaceae bacterium]